MTIEKSPAGGRIHWFRVFDALQQGKLDMLADYLIEVDGKIHPVVSRYIVKLIRGSKDDTGWRLKLANHPDRIRNERGREQRLQGSKRNMKMAFFVAELNGFERGNLDRALHEASKKFGGSVSDIKKKIAPYRDVAVLRTHALAALRNAANLDRQKNSENVLPRAK